MRPPQQSNIATPAKKFNVSSALSKAGFKLGIYGSEGIGKSSLASLCPGAVFADIEMSMKHMAVPKVQGVDSWLDLRAWIQSLTSGIAGIDTMTKAEDWAAQHVIKTKKSNDGVKASDSLEDFKYKAGLTFVNDEFKKLLADIDAATLRGVSFIMLAHNRVKKFNDPDGSNYVRSEPMLVDTDAVSNMRQWVQFLDHCAFISLDVNAEKGKASSSGTRSIYLATHAAHISKCRGIDDTQIDFKIDDMAFWQRIGVVK